MSERYSYHMGTFYRSYLLPFVHSTVLIKIWGFKIRWSVPRLRRLWANGLEHSSRREQVCLPCFSVVNQLYLRKSYQSLKSPNLELSQEDCLRGKSYPEAIFSADAFLIKKSDMFPWYIVKYFWKTTLLVPLLIPLTTKHLLFR